MGSCMAMQSIMAKYLLVEIDQHKTEKYYKGSVGGLCRGESHVIRNQEECTKAIQHLGLQSTGHYWTGMFGGIPSGCSLQTPSNIPCLETSPTGLGKGRNNQIPICLNSGTTDDLPTIVQAAVATPDLSTLVTAVTAAGLVDTLSGEGPFTVFAPNNDAFAKIPADTLASLLEPENVDQLKALLLRHVLPTTIMAGDIPEGSTTVDTAGGETITVTNADGAVTIESSAGTATVIATDVVTSNGVVHLVDTVF